MNCEIIPGLNIQLLSGTCTDCTSNEYKDCFILVRKYQ
jgi:hypothetical protein